MLRFGELLFPSSTSVPACSRASRRWVQLHEPVKCQHLVEPREAGSCLGKTFWWLHCNQSGALHKKTCEGLWWDLTANRSLSLLRLKEKANFPKHFRYLWVFRVVYSHGKIVCWIRKSLPVLPEHFANWEAVIGVLELVTNMNREQGWPGWEAGGLKLAAGATCSPQNGSDTNKDFYW